MGNFVTHAVRIVVMTSRMFGLEDGSYGRGKADRVDIYGSVGRSSL